LLADSFVIGKDAKDYKARLKYHAKKTSQIKVLLRLIELWLPCVDAEEEKIE
jgi:hypothetical protein